MPSTQQQYLHLVERGACGTLSPELADELFSAHKSTGTRTIQRAREVCSPCTVRHECLLWALDTGERGFWGGMSEAERDDILAARRNAARLRAAARSTARAQSGAV